MLYSLLDTTSLERVLPAALLLAAEKALLASKLARPMTGQRRSPGILTSLKVTLRNRGITRTMTVRQTLERLGVEGLFGAARDVLASRRPDVLPVRRAPYGVEPEVPAARLEPMPESLPIGAAAALAGLYAFLLDLPQLSERRAAIQSKRRVADQDVVSTFGGHWVNPGPVPFQLEYNAVHALLVRQFAIEDLNVRPDCWPAASRHAGAGRPDTRVRRGCDQVLRSMTIDSGPLRRKSSSSNRTRR